MLKGEVTTTKPPEGDGDTVAPENIPPITTQNYTYSGASWSSSSCART
jgi:hypothetical protein